MEHADVESSSDAYARRFSGAVGAWFLEVQARATLDLVGGLPGRPPLRVLDVGGGHGQLAGPLADAGHAVTVFGSAESCRGRVQALVDSGRVGFSTGDLLRLPFDQRHFNKHGVGPICYGLHDGITNTFIVKRFSYRFIRRILFEPRGNHCSTAKINTEIERLPRHLVYLR